MHKRTRNSSSNTVRMEVQQYPPIQPIHQVGLEHLWHSALVAHSKIVVVFRIHHWHQPIDSLQGALTLNVVLGG